MTHHMDLMVAAQETQNIWYRSDRNAPLASVNRTGRQGLRMKQAYSSTSIAALRLQQFQR